MKKNSEENSRQKKKSTKIIIGILMLILIVALLAFLVTNHFLNKINRENMDDIISADDETFETDGDGGIDPDSVKLGEVSPLDDEDLINILLIGQDRRPGEGRQRSDTMILCSINPETNKVSMISFMRDLYVQLPGNYSANRLNAPYAFGGFELLKQTLKMNFGISIDGCFEVDFNGFEDAVNIVGGVDIEMSATEAGIVGGGATAGMNHLNGEQALAYARIRMIDNDFHRTERQRKVLTSVFNSLDGLSLGQLKDLANKLLPCMTTDLSNVEIMSLISQCHRVVGTEVSNYRVPEDNAYYGAMIRGMDVLVPDLPLIRSQLETYLPLD